MIFRLMIAIKHDATRDLFSKWMKGEELAGKFELVQECKYYHEIPRKFSEVLPDILISDIELADKTECLAILREILIQRPSTRIIGTTLYYQEKIAVSLKQLGAKGYLIKTYEITDITKVLLAVYENQTLIKEIKYPKIDISQLSLLKLGKKKPPAEQK